MSQLTPMEDGMVSFECPHCNVLVVVHTNEMNCKIFRCGMYKNSGQQIPPHTDKKTCDELFRDSLIHGCGKPFMVEDSKVVKCDYM